MTHRRDFLRLAAAGTAAAVLPDLARAATEHGVPGVDLAKHLKVPLLGIGTGVKGGNRSNALLRSGAQNFRDTIRRAYDEGVRLFDCADMYGSLSHVASALKDKPRDSYVLVTKVWCHPKGGIPDDEPRDDSAAVVERSLREAGTDYLDLVQLHCQTAADWTATYRKHMDALAACKRKGWLRAHGCSCHSLAALEAAAADPWVDVVHARINPWGVKMDGPADKVVPVLKRIHAAGKGIIGMKLVGEGDFRHDPAKIDESLRYVLALDCVDAIIVGFENPAEVVDYRKRLRTALAATKTPGS
jgi:aryl-alcohol dehydrogenase-like predicted oxidoreductase